MKIERAHHIEQFILVVVEIANLADRPDTIDEATLNECPAEKLPRTDRHRLADVPELSLPVTLGPHEAEKGVLGFPLGFMAGDILGKVVSIRNIAGATAEAEITYLSAGWKWEKPPIL